MNPTFVHSSFIYLGVIAGRGGAEVSWYAKWLLILWKSVQIYEWQRQLPEVWHWSSRVWSNGFPFCLPQLPPHNLGSHLLPSGGGEGYQIDSCVNIGMFQCFSGHSCAWMATRNSFLSSWEEKWQWTISLKISKGRKEICDKEKFCSQAFILLPLQCHLSYGILDYGGAKDVAKCWRPFCKVVFYF